MIASGYLPDMKSPVRKPGLFLCRRQPSVRGGSCGWELLSTDDHHGKARRQAAAVAAGLRRWLMRTPTRWAILVKLPVALSGLITANSEPAAGEKLLDMAGQALVSKTHRP